MPTRSKHAPGLADPTRLPSFESKGPDLTVIIETPKGSRNKYAYNPEDGIFELRKVLPAGMARFLTTSALYLPRWRVCDAGHR